MQFLYHLDYLFKLLFLDLMVLMEYTQEQLRLEYILQNRQVAHITICLVLGFSILHLQVTQIIMVTILEVIGFWHQEVMELQFTQKIQVRMQTMFRHQDGRHPSLSPQPNEASHNIYCLPCFHILLH